MNGCSGVSVCVPSSLYALYQQFAEQTGVPTRELIQHALLFWAERQGAAKMQNVIEKATAESRIERVCLEQGHIALGQKVADDTRPPILEEASQVVMPKTSHLKH